MTLGNGGETMGLRELSTRAGGGCGRVKIYDEGVYHEPEVAITVISYHCLLHYSFIVSLLYYCSHSKSFSVATLLTFLFQLLQPHKKPHAWGICVPTEVNPLTRMYACFSLTECIGAEIFNLLFLSHTH